MRSKEKLKQSICEAVERRRAEIEKIGDHIMENPELEFKGLNRGGAGVQTTASNWKYGKRAKNWIDFRA